jgi:hypothetical protein
MVGIAIPIHHTCHVNICFCAATTYYARMEEVKDGKRISALLSCRAIRHVGNQGVRFKV